MWSVSIMSVTTTAMVCASPGDHKQFDNKTDGSPIPFMFVGYYI
jgi:hypothetical protein